MATRLAPVSPSKRFAVLLRDGFRCRYCGRSPEDGIRLHVDHIHPVARGGSNEMDNLVAACSECNTGKAARLLRPEPGNLDIPLGSRRTEKPRRRQYRAVDPLAEFWVIGSHCATPIKIAAIAMQLGFNTYAEAWMYFNKIRPPDMQMPPQRYVDKGWLTVLRSDPDYALEMQATLVRSLERARKAAA